MSRGAPGSRTDRVADQRPSVDTVSRGLGPYQSAAGDDPHPGVGGVLTQHLDQRTPHQRRTVQRIPRQPSARNFRQQPPGAGPPATMTSVRPPDFAFTEEVFSEIAFDICTPRVLVKGCGPLARIAESGLDRVS